MNHTPIEFGCLKCAKKQSHQNEKMIFLKKYPDDTLLNDNSFSKKFTRKFSICNIFSSANHIISVHCRCVSKLSTHFKQSRLNCVTKPKSFCVERNEKTQIIFILMAFIPLVQCVPYCLHDRVIVSANIKQ